MIIRVLLPVILLALGIASCAPPPEVRSENFLKDQSLLTGAPCQAPCWRNITPGETFWRDAMIIIEDDPQLTDIETQEVEVPDLPDSRARVAQWSGGNGQVCCQMFSRDGETVSALFLWVAPEMRLGDVLESVGQPQYLSGEVVTDNQAIMPLYFPDVPLIVTAFVDGVENGVLSDMSEIVNVVYLSPEDMRDAIAATNLYRWDGYGTYKDYIDGDFDLLAETEEVDEGTE